MCGTPTLIVKNTFFCVADESSPKPQQRVRAKTAGAPAALADWASELDADADTSEGISDSNSSAGFASDEQDSSQHVQCIVKNTFICVDEAGSPARPQRARAKTAHVAVTWEEEMVEEACADVDDGEAPMLHIATQWSYGNGLACRTGDVPKMEEASDEVDDGEASMLHMATQWSFGERPTRRVSFAPRPEITNSSPVLAFDDEECCQSARSTLENSGAAERRALIAALQGRVREAARSPFAHKVLEAVLLYTGTDEAAFIADELMGFGNEKLLDSSTCSVLCCLLEHSPADLKTVALMDELLSGDAAAVCSHKNGHKVAAAIIANGIPRQAAQVVLALHSNLQRFARHRFASKVVEVALRSWMAAGSDSLARELIAQSGTIVNLACHNFGVHVVRALLASPMYSCQVLHFLFAAARRLSKDKYGRELLRELGAVPVAAVH